MRDEDPCGDPLGLSVLISEICKTRPVTTEDKMRQKNLAKGFSKQGPHSPGSLQHLLRGREVKIILLIILRHYLTFVLC